MFWLEKLTFAALLLTLIWLGITSKVADPEPIPPEKLPVLRIELATSPEDFEKAVGKLADTEGNPDAQTEERIKVMIKNTHMDYGFIALYWLVFVCLGLLAGQVTSRPVAIAGALLITAAAICDCRENIGILRALEPPNFTTDAALAISGPSLVKWYCLFTTLVVVGAAFAIAQGVPVGVKISGLLLLGAGLGGWLGFRYYRPLQMEGYTFIFASRLGLLGGLTLFLISLGWLLWHGRGILSSGRA